MPAGRWALGRVPVLQRLMLVALPLVLLAAACGGGDAQPAGPEAAAQPSPTAVETPDWAGESSVPSGPDPFSLLVGRMEGFDPADPVLAALLVKPEDLPEEFVLVGEYGASASTEFGTVTTAFNMFSAGAVRADALESVVYSMVVTVPPGARSKMADIADGMGPDELAEVRESLELMAVHVKDLRPLDLSGVGEGGYGFRVECDYAGFLEGLDVEPQGPATTLVMDSHAFLRGDRLFRLIVIGDAASSTTVDARALVEAMDARAAGRA